MTCRGASRVIEYATRHYSAGDNQETKVLRRRMMLAGIYDPRAVGFFFLIRTVLAVAVATALFFVLPADHGGPTFWLLTGLGGIVGYGCYMTALSRLPLAIVSIYTYVNPVVAVFLGWLAYREPFGWREALAMAVIFLGVWMVRRASAAADKLRADGPAQRRR